MYPFSKNIQVLSLLLTIILLVGCSETESIQGNIIDRFGNPIDSALVVIKNQPINTYTDANGDFYLASYPKGAFEIEIQKEGYTTEKTNLILDSPIGFDFGQTILYPPPYIADPGGATYEITSLHPASGSPGSEITIRGKHFAPSEMNVSFTDPNNVSLTVFHNSVDHVSQTELKLIVPANIQCGEFNVRVFNGTGLLSNGIPYAVTSDCSYPPEIHEISPQVEFPGRPVLIQGEHFFSLSELSIRQVNSPYAVVSDYLMEVVDDTSIRVFLPDDLACDLYTIRVVNPLLAKESNPATHRVRCPTFSDWMFKWETLKVIHSSERHGDEPYLIFIGFQTELVFGGETAVGWSEELHLDWGDDMEAGEVRSIPQEVGELSFPDITIKEVNFDNPLPDIDGLELFGGILIAMEYDTAGSAEVKSTINCITDELDTQLTELFNEGGLVQAVLLDEKSLDEVLQETSDSVLEACGRGNGGGGGGGIKKWFGPEEIGSHIFVFPAVTQNPNVPYNPLISVLAPREGDLAIRFDGKGAAYLVEGRLSNDYIRNPALVISVAKSMALELEQ